MLVFRIILIALVVFIAAKRSHAQGPTPGNWYGTRNTQPRASAFQAQQTPPCKTCGLGCLCTTADNCGCLQTIQAKVEPPKAAPLAPLPQPQLVCGPNGCQMLLVPPGFQVPQAMPAAPAKFGLPVNVRVYGPLRTWLQDRRAVRAGVCK